MLQVSNIHYGYNSRPALNGLSFCVQDGERYAVLGPNGSGKSTLFKILSTLVEPLSGSVRYFNGQFDRRQIRMRLGVLFQSPALDKKLSGFENLFLYGRLFGLPGHEIRTRIAEISGQLSLENFLGQPTQELSGGFQRRVELAKVLVSRPQILIMDEPTTGFDPGARDELWWFLEAARQRDNLTVIYSTHYFDEASHASRVLLLNAGEACAAGTPSELSQTLGGDLLRVDSKESESLSEGLQSHFGLNPIVRGCRLFADVSTQKQNLARIYEYLTGRASHVTIGKPDLTDVFYIKTGTDMGTI